MDYTEKVLILLSVYNGNQFLGEQLKSIVEQEDVEIELMIRDDGSTDNTEEIIDEWSGKIVINYWKGENIGAAKSFMELLRNAPEDYTFYAFADQDDYWESNKIKVAVDKIQTEKDRPALYYSDVRRVGSYLEPIQDPFKKNYHTETLQSALIVASAPGCTMVFNRALLETLKKYVPGDFYMHDEWMLRVAAAVGGRITYDPVPHILYRQHGSNTVSGLAKENYGFFRLLRYRINKFLDFSYSPYLTAKELQQGYWEVMADKEKEAVKLILESHKSYVGRLKLLLSGKVRTPYLIYNLKFGVQIILNRL